MKKISFFLLTLFIISFILFGFRYGHILMQEEGTIRLVLAVSILDFTSRDYVEFDETEYVTRYVSKNDTKPDIIKKVLSDLGWSYQTKEGAALYFKRDKETVVVETNLFTDNYFFWDLPIESFE